MQLWETHGAYDFMFGSEHAVGSFLTVYNGVDEDGEDIILFQADALGGTGSTPELKALASTLKGASYNTMIGAVRKHLGV